MKTWKIIIATLFIIFIASPALSQPITLVTVGDSLTAGIPGSSYLAILRKKLPDHTLIDLGRGNDTVISLYRRIARRILADTADYTVEEGAKRLGLVPHDIKNLRAGNLPSLQQLLRLIAKGRYCPEALIFNDELRKLPPRVSTRQAQRRLISARIRKLAMASNCSKPWAGVPRSCTA